MSSRDYDLLLYGATGFTGRQTARYLRDHGGDLRWAIAGRNRGKLEQLRDQLGGAPAVEVADAGDRQAVMQMVAKARVVITTAGPYALYGDNLVDACVEHRAHYADITGETAWVRQVIDRAHDRAAASGTRLVPFAGYDSVPSDLGTWVAVRALQERGQACRWVRGYFSGKGGINGGTVASALHMFSSGAQERMNDPVLLNPPEHRDAQGVPPDQRSAHYDRAIGRWTAPFFMEMVNTRVVRRSAALMQQYGTPYGDDFAYRESMLVGGPLTSSALALGSRLGTVVLQRSWGRKLVERVAPKPGEGPSQQQRDSGFVKVVLIGEGDGGARVRVTMIEQGDPGNRMTIKCLGETGLALATDQAELPGGAERGGVLTPATALGDVLVRRLRAAGVRIEVTPG